MYCYLWVEYRIESVSIDSISSRQPHPAMLFKRIGTTKHSYSLSVTLSTIKYCPWDTDRITIVLCRGDRHEESPPYKLSKGRCNLDNHQLTTSCTMYFDGGKYLPKEAELKIKAYDLEKKQGGHTLAKIKLELENYTEEDRPYEEQFLLDQAKLSCSIHMKMLDEETKTSENRTELTHKSKLTVRTEKLDKRKERSASKERRNTLQFGKEREREREREGEVKEKDDTTLQILRQKKGRESVDASSNSEKRSEKEKKNEVAKKVDPFDEQPGKEKKSSREKRSSKEEEASTVETKIRSKPNRVEIEKASTQESESKKKAKEKESYAREYIYQKEIEQKNHLIERIQEENQSLRKLLEDKVNSQPLPDKEADRRALKIQEQNSKLKQKLVQKQIQLSQYELKLKNTKESEAKLSQETNAAKILASQLREQLQTIKDRVAEAYVDSLETGNSDLVDFMQEHFSSE